jgi:hypothetical protein
MQSLLAGREPLWQGKILARWQTHEQGSHGTGSPEAHCKQRVGGRAEVMIVVYQYKGMAEGSTRYVVGNTASRLVNVLGVRL